MGDDTPKGKSGSHIKSDVKLLIAKAMSILHLKAVWKRQVSWLVTVLLSFPFA